MWNRTTIIRINNLVNIFVGFILFMACESPVRSVRNNYHYTAPDYNKYRLIELADTLYFRLDEDIYNDVKAFNVFNENGHSYISFYDRRSGFLIVYNVSDQTLYKRINVKNILKNKKLYKTSVFVKNWDSLFIINRDILYLYDSAGTRKLSIKSLTKPHYAWAIFESNNLPIVRGTKLYAIVRPSVRYKSINALRNWNVLYDFDLVKGTAQLHYYLPESYQQQLYGYQFMDYNFCVNNKGQFVFSFPADTVIYETDLSSYNRSYFAKSRYQNKDISPVSKAALDNDQDSKEHAIRHSYGSIFFDPYRKCYLRLSRQKITTEEYAQKRRKKVTVLILDERFKVIGESDWPENVDFNSIFFTADGKLYARTSFRDENTLKFVQFNYRIVNSSSMPLTKN